MLTSSVRIKGERDSWWEDVTRLLSGRGIRRGNPEEVATETSVRNLKRAMHASGNDSSHAKIGLAISHDGLGVRRAVTVVAYTNQDPAPREAERLLAQDDRRDKLSEPMCPVKDDLRGYLRSLWRSLRTALPPLRAAAERIRTLGSGAAASLRRRQ